jgi:aryl-alcohol dehydrogenase-like predicted oxidoreductase
MQYRNLGRTGIKFSPYALGALMLAPQVGNPDPEDSIQIIHKALDAGITSLIPLTRTETRRRLSVGP